VLKGLDIVCLSTQDWSGLWTRKQRFMQMFARNNRVLYIESPVHLLGLDVLPSDPTRAMRFLQGPREVETNLHVATLPLLLPAFQMSRIINRVNHTIVGRYLKKWTRALGFEKPLLWIYTPFSAPVVDQIAHRGIVYECVDEFRAARGFVRANVIGSMEDELLGRANVTIVTQENLIAHRAAICPNTFCIPNGADTDLFRRVIQNDTPPPPEIDKLPRPRLGFVGHVHYWLDLKLIRFLALKRPAWSFVFVGPVAPLADMAAVKGIPNVHFLGRQPRERVPAFVKAMDCCLNPYVTGTLAEHCSPLKLYEYIAAGKPIVSTDMPEARKFPDCVRVAGSYEEFLEQCDSAIQSLPESSQTIEHRMNIASEHSWDKRFAKVNEVVDGVLEVP
jgi:glycosyltransferase involved in cell wall biosynthesis